MKMRTKLALTMMLAIILLTTSALALTGLIFSPRYDALLLANQALKDKYGITEAMQPGLLHTITEKEDAVVITYEVVESEVLRENRFGTYTVTVADGKADAVWSLDGMDTSGGLDAPAWGAEQLMMYVQDWGSVFSYMEPRNMLMNAPLTPPAPEGVPDKWERDKQTALSMEQITLEDAAAIGREAVIVRYGLTEQQAAMLVRFTDIETDGTADESTYEIINGRPLVNLFFHLTQHPGTWTAEGYYQPGTWQEKDGTYVVTVNLLDGAVEDVFYDNGLMGNG